MSKAKSQSTPKKTEEKTEKTERKAVSLDDVLPFPLSEMDGTCSVCGKEFSNHFYMDFFLQSKHVDLVEKYLKRLRLLLDSTLNAYDKLKGTDGASRFWGEKPIVETLTEAYKSDPFLANVIPRLAAHYDSAEKTEFRTRAIGNALFSNVTTKFRALHDKWVSEFWVHKELDSDEWYIKRNLGIQIYESKYDKRDDKSNEIDETFIVEKAIKDSNNLFYKKFLSEHEFDAKHDYQKLRSWFSEVDGFIHGFQESTQKYLEPSRFGSLKNAITEKNKKAPSPKVKVSKS